MKGCAVKVCHLIWSRGPKYFVIGTWKRKYHVYLQLTLYNKYRIVPSGDSGPLTAVVFNYF